MAAEPGSVRHRFERYFLVSGFGADANFGTHEGARL
jgi:hypothetical protein